MGPIAYVYDADTYCEECTVKKYGSTEGDDSEGNPIGAQFSWDEWWDGGPLCEVLSCGDCHTVLDVAHNPDCENSVISDRWDADCVLAICEGCSEPLTTRLAGAMGPVEVRVWVHQRTESAMLGGCKATPDNPHVLESANR